MYAQIWMKCSVCFLTFGPDPHAGIDYFLEKSTRNKCIQHETRCYLNVFLNVITVVEENSSKPKHLNPNKPCTSMLVDADKSGNLKAGWGVRRKSIVSWQHVCTHDTLEAKHMERQHVCSLSQFPSWNLEPISRTSWCWVDDEEQQPSVFNTNTFAYFDLKRVSVELQWRRKRKNTIRKICEKSEAAAIYFPISPAALMVNRAVH